MVIITGDYMATLRNDVWNLFCDMAYGAKVFLFHPSNGPTLWVIPPPSPGRSFYYADAEVSKPLLDSGLIEEKPVEEPQKAPGSAEAEYVFTEKGTQLFVSGIEPQMRKLGAEIFFTHVKIE